MVVSIPSFLPDRSWFHHLVGNVPGTEWLGYRGWEGTKALLSYLILPFPNHPGDQEKRLGVESVRCKEQISKPYTFTWKFLVPCPYSSPRLEGTCGKSTFLSSNEINLIKWARRAINRNMYYLLTCSHRDIFISLPHSTKDLRWNDFILKGPDKALSNGYHLDSKENSENMGQNRGSNRHQHVNRPHLGASLQVENALIVKSILFREFLQWYKLYQTDTSFHSP